MSCRYLTACSGSPEAAPVCPDRSVYTPWSAAAGVKLQRLEKKPLGGLRILLQRGDVRQTIICLSVHILEVGLLEHIEI